MKLKNTQTEREAVLPLSLFSRLKSCEVSCLARDGKGNALTGLRTYKGKSVCSSLTVTAVSESEELAHRVAALLLLQSGGVASFYRSRNLGGVVARVSLPVGVCFVVEGL